MVGEAHQARRVKGEQSNGENGSAIAGRAAFKSSSAHQNLAALIRIVAAVALAASGPPQSASAQTFDEASTRALNELCVENEITGFPELGPNLQQRCNDRGNASSGVLSPVPATASRQPAGPAIERRLQTVRESEERRREAGATRAIYASYRSDAALAANVQLQLPPAGGATPDVVVSPAQGLSLFVSAGAFALNHHNNRFEDGYEAQLPTVTIGADYWLTSRLAGVAFNYTNFDGTYDDGGGFDKDIFSPLLYATFLPFDGAYLSAVLGYSRNENANNRRVGTFRLGTEPLSQAIRRLTIPRICTPPDSRRATIIQSATSLSVPASG
jgi:hypothetical protein